jgi:hypothetical protein
VCGAQSCPPIRVYSSSNLESGLVLATKAFCNDQANVRLDLTRKEIGLSQIFEWYYGDFVQKKADLPSWIINYLNEEKQHQLQELLRHETHKIVPLKYNWSVNTKNQLPVPSKTLSDS